MIVVDTNVASELMRPSPSPSVLTWLRAQHAAVLYTTAITVAEITFGLARLPEGQRTEVLSTAATEVFAVFSDHVLAFDARAAGEYAKIVVRRERAGNPISGFDAQIASICRAHNAILATRNVQDFDDTGIDLTNPWDNPF